jgi:hypothetical protein
VVRPCVHRRIERARALVKNAKTFPARAKWRFF